MKEKTKAQPEEEVLPGKPGRRSRIEMWGALAT